MQIFITGATGFLGRNLINRLEDLDAINIIEHNRFEDADRLIEKIEKADLIFHFAAVHRPKDPIEYVTVNQNFTATILQVLRKVVNKAPIIYSSSIQAFDDTEYGRSKLAAERLLIQHAELLQSQVFIYRLNNIFGKWARPNQHSVIATWCHNISRGLPIRIDEPDRVMKMLHVDDVIDCFLTHTCDSPHVSGQCYKDIDDRLVHQITLKDIAETLYSIHEGRFQLNGYEENFRIKLKLFMTFITYIS
jgi:UDP-2-acetamido-2,6-beta-L-arabino-hexul-4-ose reductase